MRAIFLFLLVSIVACPANAASKRELPSCGLVYLAETTTDYANGVTFEWATPRRNIDFYPSYSIDVPMGDYGDNTLSLPKNAHQVNFSVAVGTHTFYFYMFQAVHPYYCGETRPFSVPTAARPHPESATLSPDMMRRIDGIRKIVAEEKSDDPAAIKRLYGKLFGTWLPYEKPVYKFILDPKIDWRVRYFCALSVVGSVPAGDMGEFFSVLGKILTNDDENLRFREEIAIYFREIHKNREIEVAYGKLIKDKKVPRPILEEVFKGISSGCTVDDVDYLIGLYRWDKSYSAQDPGEIPVASVNDAVITGAAISKSTAAIDFIFRAFEKTDCKMCVLKGFSILTWRDPVTQAKISDRLIPVLLEYFRQPKSAKLDLLQLFSQLKDKRVVPDVVALLKPVEEGGANEFLLFKAIQTLVDIGDKSAIPYLEKLRDGFASDSRWINFSQKRPWRKVSKFPEGATEYKQIVWSIEKLKGNDPGPYPQTDN